MVLPLPVEPVDRFRVPPGADVDHIPGGLVVNDRQIVVALPCRCLVDSDILHWLFLPFRQSAGNGPWLNDVLLFSLRKSTQSRFQGA